MSFGPKKIQFQDILLNALGSFLAGVIGSIFIIIITFAISGLFDIVGTFGRNDAGTVLSTNAIFPLLLSFITLIGTCVTSFLTYNILHMTDPEKYKKNFVIFGQIAFFQVLLYIFITPIYIYTGLQDYANIMIVYLFHVTFIVFGTSVILEILNNYRYLLIGFYGSFVGVFFSSIFTLIIFNSFTSGYSRLISLVLLLPIINFFTTFFKQVFELAYYRYTQFSSLDQLGDIFYQIEMEEKEKLREEEEKNTI